MPKQGRFANFIIRGYYKVKKKQFKPLNIRSTELLNRSRVISPMSVNETHRKALNVINSGNNNIKKHDYGRVFCFSAFVLTL